MRLLVYEPSLQNAPCLDTGMNACLAQRVISASNPASPGLRFEETGSEYGFCGNLQYRAGKTESPMVRACPFISVVLGHVCDIGECGVAAHPV